MESLPLFLLNIVLFPRARLPLKVFEARYLDMVSDCLKHDRPFGVCLIREGREVGEPAVPARVGTRAYVEKWEMPTPGVLHIQVRGAERFEIVHTRIIGRLVTADVTLWPDGERQPLAPEHEHLVEFLRQVVAKYGERALPEPHDFADADWVGMRLAELLPVDNLLKQAWLEERDALARLNAIGVTLAQLAHDDAQLAHDE